MHDVTANTIIIIMSDLINFMYRSVIRSGTGSNSSIWNGTEISNFSKFHTQSGHISSNSGDYI